MIQFYAPEIDESNILPEGESIHCSRVLRMKAGDEIVVTDGKGSRYICVIENPHPKNTSFYIKEKIEVVANRNYKVTLAVAPTKNPDRMEWMAEKAVELGVDRIVLLKCERSERKFLKSERLKKVMIAAMKQSLGTVLPELVEMTAFNLFVGDDFSGQKFFGYCSADYPKKEFAKECNPESDVVIMIGPEGDFTPSEVELAVKSGFVPVTFGNKRLRTETAGVFAIAAVDVINQLS